MELPFELHKKIVNFLTSLPNIHDSNNQRALIYSAGLGELQAQIPFGSSSAQFFQVMINILINYGNLSDGRNAFNALLEATKIYVGQDRQNYCDGLIQELRAVQEMSSRPGATSEKQKRPISYTLRPQVRHFVNREHIREQLKVDLRDKQKVIIAVDGLAGIGKTSLAAKIAEEVEDEFTGIYWTKCTPETDLDQLLSELAYFLGEHDDHTA